MNKETAITSIFVTATLVIMFLPFLSHFTVEAGINNETEKTTFGKKKQKTAEQNEKPHFTTIKTSLHDTTAAGIPQKTVIEHFPSIKCNLPYYDYNDYEVIEDPASLIGVSCHTTNAETGGSNSISMDGDYVNALENMQSVLTDNTITKVRNITNLDDDEKLSLLTSQAYEKHNEWIEENENQPKNITLFMINLGGITTFYNEVLDEEKLNEELEHVTYPLLNLTTGTQESKAWTLEKMLATREEVLRKDDPIPFEDLDFGASKITYRKTFGDWEIAILAHKFGWHGYDVPQFASMIVATSGQIDAMIRVRNFVRKYDTLFDHPYHGFGRDPVSGTKKAPRWNIGKETLSYGLDKDDIVITNNARAGDNIYETIYKLGRQGLSTSYTRTQKDLPKTIATDVQGFVVNDWALIRSSLETAYKKALLNSLLSDNDIADYILQDINKNYTNINDKNTPQGLGYELYLVRQEGNRITIDMNHPEKIKLEDALLQIIFKNNHQEVKKVIDDVLVNNSSLNNTPYFAIKSVPIPLLITGNHNFEHRTHNWNGGSITSNARGFYLRVVEEESEDHDAYHTHRADDHTDAGHVSRSDLAAMLGDDWEIFITSWWDTDNKRERKVYTVYILRKGQFEELQRVLGMLDILSYK